MKISKLYGLALAATMLVASIAQAETLTLSTPDSDTSEITLAANKFAEIVSKRLTANSRSKCFRTARFMAAILRRALSSWPAVRSTCS